MNGALVAIKAELRTAFGSACLEGTVVQQFHDSVLVKFTDGTECWCRPDQLEHLKPADGGQSVEA